MTDSTNVNFSVVIPLFNKAPYVRASVLSALAQTHMPTEVFVIDDGSTDGSVDQIADLLDRVQVVRQPNLGQGAARNRGAELSRCEWVAFLDADDWWDSAHLAELAQLVRSHLLVGMVASNYVRGTMPPSQSSRVWIPARKNPDTIDYFRVAARDIGVAWSSAVAIRKSVLRRVGGFSNDQAGEDLVCWTRVALQAPVAVSRRRTALYRTENWWGNGTTAVTECPRTTGSTSQRFVAVCRSRLIRACSRWSRC